MAVNIKDPVRVKFKLSSFQTMHPLVEYSSILLGLALGYTRGGYWGSALLISSLIAALHLYMQGGRWEVFDIR